MRILSRLPDASRERAYMDPGNRRLWRWTSAITRSIVAGLVSGYTEESTRGPRRRNSMRLSAGATEAMARMAIVERR